MLNINLELIDNYILKNNLSEADFCKLCKIGRRTLDKIRNKENFRLSNIIKIANFLQIDPLLLFIKNPHNE